MTKLLCILFLHFFTVTFCFCQLTVNDTLFINQNGLFYVNTNLVNNNYLENYGDCYVQFDLENNNQIIGGNNNAKLILKKNWINNGLNFHNEMTTYLDGAEQVIKGSKPSQFYNLDLSGYGLKILANHCSSSYLNLNDNEFATDKNILTINSYDETAILFNDGFVSSLDSGKLERNVLKNKTYVFPLGSNQGSVIQKKVLVKPTISDSNIYGARLVNHQPDLIECPKDYLNSTIEKINDSYYYHLYNNHYDKGLFSFELNTFENSNWEGVSHWNNTEWSPILNSVKSSIGIEASIDNFDSRNFSFYKGKSNIYIPNSFTPNEDLSNDFFQIITQEIQFSYFEFSIFNRWGNLIFKSNQENFKWDGKFLNELVPDGVYVWKMNYKTPDNIEIFTQQGTITLFR